MIKWVKKLVSKCPLEESRFSGREELLHGVCGGKSGMPHSWGDSAISVCFPMRGGRVIAVELGRLRRKCLHESSA
jgi:hypothetical protein